MVEVARIADSGAAAVFRSSRQRGILLALIDRERSLSELATATGAPLNLLHHHLQKLLRLGLVKIARTEKRAGAPIKHYRAVARSFFVPAELMGAEPGVELTSVLRERLEQSLAGSIRGAMYSQDESGPRMRLVREAGRRPVASELWLRLRLSDKDAAALAEEIRQLLHRFHARRGSSRRSYLVHAALAPDRH
jgi:hypothetical protein